MLAAADDTKSVYTWLSGDPGRTAQTTVQEQDGPDGEQDWHGRGERGSGVESPVEAGELILFRCMVNDPVTVVAAVRTGQLRHLVPPKAPGRVGVRRTLTVTAVGGIGFLDPNRLPPALVNFVYSILS